MNDTLCNILSSLANTEGDDWDSALSLALTVYRTKPHASTKLSPFEMTFGRAPRTIPGNIFINPQEATPFHTKEMYLEALKKSITSMNTIR